MKRLSIALLGTIATGLAATMTAAMADSAAAQAQGASLLQTQPASVNQVRTSPQRSQGTYSSDSLSSISATLQANPKKPAEKPLLPIPDGIAPSKPSNTSVNPLEFFQVPKLDQGVSVTVGRD